MRRSPVPRRCARALKVFEHEVRSAQGPTARRPNPSPMTQRLASGPHCGIVAVKLHDGTIESVLRLFGGLSAIAFLHCSALNIFAMGGRSAAAHRDLR
jgi:hypothetical protein